MGSHRIVARSSLHTSPGPPPRPPHTTSPGRVRSHSFAPARAAVHTAVRRDEGPHLGEGGDLLAGGPVGGGGFFVRGWYRCLHAVVDRGEATRAGVVLGGARL
jgi:hypothetical protein